MVLLAMAAAATLVAFPLVAEEASPPEADPAELAEPAPAEGQVAPAEGEATPAADAPAEQPSETDAAEGAAGEPEKAEPAPVEASAGADTATPPPAQGSTAPPKSRINTRSASITIRSFAPEETMDRAVTKIEELGGWVQSSSSGSAEMRLPILALDQAVIALRDIGEVVDEQVSSEDVTLEIVTVKARIQELESSRQRVVGMLASSSTVGDSLSVEKELRSVTDELESNQGRLRYLQNRTTIAPLNIYVSMKARPRVENPRKRTPFGWVANYGLPALINP